MTTYAVIRKSDQKEVYRYSSEAAVEWIGFEFVTHDHNPLPDAPQPDAPPPVSRRLTKLAFVGLLGNDFVPILQAAKVNAEVEAFTRMLDWATPDPDGTSVDLADPRVIYALNRLEQAQVIAAGRAQEILNG